MAVGLSCEQRCESPPSKPDAGLSALVKNPGQAAGRQVAASWFCERFESSSGRCRRVSLKVDPDRQPNTVFGEKEACCERKHVVKGRTKPVV